MCNPPAHHDQSTANLSDLRLHYVEASEIKSSNQTMSSDGLVLPNVHLDQTTLRDVYQSYVWLRQMKNEKMYSYEEWCQLSESERKRLFHS